MKNDKDKLINDYLDLCESYQDEMTPPCFAGVILSICSKMCYDLAPSHEVADELIKSSIEFGKKLSEKENK